uniref:Ycf2 N-terminal domain-containing protein n=1 Tax=Solanum lycopersicum TaxID=4081 RepID=A0A3Q7EWP9_SOLLC
MNRDPDAYRYKWSNGSKSFQEHLQLSTQTVMSRFPLVGLLSGTNRYGYSRILSCIMLDLTAQWELSTSSNTKDGKSIGLSGDNPDVLNCNSKFKGRRRYIKREIMSRPTVHPIKAPLMTMAVPMVRMKDF